MEVISFIQPQEIHGKRYQPARAVASAMPSFTTAADLLQRQQPVRDKTGETRKSAAQIIEAASSSFRTAGRIVYGLRYALLSAAVFLALVSGWFFSVYLYNLAPRAVSFEAAALADMPVTATAMKQFVMPPIDVNIVSENAVASPTGSYIEPVQFKTYTVRKGDSVSSIASRFGLSNMSTIIAVNNIDNVRRLQAGQQLLIPGIDGITHTVKKNETLAGIAASYKVPMESLLDVNDLASAVIHAGDTLFIPGAALSSVDLRKAMGELFISPLTCNWRLTSSYGSRADPFTGVRSYHTGIDMAAPQGSSIRAALDGKVAATGFSNVYGNYVIISHGGGYQTLYGHMTSYSVRTGQSVRQGDAIGKVGSTGYSTGNHLHFTVYKNGKTVNPFDFLN